MESTDLSWRPLASPDLEARIEAVLARWDGTPYMKGQQCRGAGVDCLRYVTAVLDELNGFARCPIPNIPQDAAMHDPTLAARTMRAIINAYGPATVVRDRVVEPGDVVVVGPPGGGPGHAMIVGSPYRIWHATNRSVQRTGMTIVGMKVFRVYRPIGKERWSR